MSETLGTAGMVARDGIAAVCASGLATLELLGEVARRVATVMPYDSGAWMSLDPVTLLPTGSHLVGTDTARATASLHRRFGENEVFVPDFLKLRDLARGQLSVGTLLQATGGKITRSARQREINAPLGIVDEIRSVFRSNGTAWGAASLGRFEGRPSYSEAELAFLTGVGEHIANGLRLALLREAPAVDDEQPAVPGLLVLDEHEQIASLTPEAQLWIAQIPPDGNADAELPAAIYLHRAAGASTREQRVRRPPLGPGEDPAPRWQLAARPRHHAARPRRRPAPERSLSRACERRPTRSASRRGSRALGSGARGDRATPARAHDRGDRGQALHLTAYRPRSHEGDLWQVRGS